MSEENGTSSSKFKAAVVFIFVFIPLLFVWFYLIPHLLNKDLGEMDTYIAQSVKDLESGINMNSLVGDYRIYKYGEWTNETISCNVKDRDIIFSGNAIDGDYKVLFDMLSSTRFTLTSKEPMIFEGNVLVKKESKAESRRIKTRITSDGESRLIISSWDDDSGKWKKWTGNLYFEKF